MAHQSPGGNVSTKALSRSHTLVSTDGPLSGYVDLMFPLEPHELEVRVSYTDDEGPHEKPIEVALIS